jgi:hypothetical protein
MSNRIYETHFNEQTKQNDEIFIKLDVRFNIRRIWVQLRGTGTMEALNSDQCKERYPTIHSKYFKH